MRQRTAIYICDVCGRRFPVARAAVDAEREIICPRCRTPLVRPAARKPMRNGPEVPRCMAFS